ncbi:MAG: RNA polymerase factor sigma-54 [Faecalibacterium sp.]|jgi:RNA polymerase sigma-54 factor|nr:RNA polymerase factor sigma-54 [Faecalibacterium sp.]
MSLEQTNKPRTQQGQRLILSPSQQEAIRFLQMPLPALCQYLEQAALSNPMLEVELAPTESILSPLKEDALGSAFSSVTSSSNASSDLTTLCTQAPTFTEYLNAQLGQSAALSSALLSQCRYLVGCLDTRGYLNIPLSSLAEEMHLSLLQAEQALYVVQSLDPAGVGARSLQECLTLQLVQSHFFCETSLHLIEYGLPLLARKDYAGLDKLLHTARSATLEACSIVAKLNPIPSSGFYSGGENVSYTFAEAEIIPDGGELRVTLADELLYSIHIHTDYLVHSGSLYSPEEKCYIRQKTAEANQLMDNIARRRNTLYTLICTLAEYQRDYFLSQQPLRPLTMQQLADSLSLHVSTVSRACQDKYIRFGGRMLPLRELFSMPAPSAGDASLSVCAIRRILQSAIKSEDSAHPFTDEQLCALLARQGISLSRRTVAKYRDELGIANHFSRQQKSLK